MDRIIDDGYCPHIRGSRLSVYDVMDYTTLGWPAERIANWLKHDVLDIQAAIDYIDTHREAVEKVYAEILERNGANNPPEPVAVVEARIARLKQRRDEIRAARIPTATQTPGFARG
ncbi:MAG: DUF433 domain-containing protein [Fimbriiglobus sp.]